MPQAEVKSTPAWRASVVLAALPLLAASAGPARAAQAPSLQQRVESLVWAFQQGAEALVGVSAVHVRTGEQIVAIRPRERRIPASAQKLLTSAFALARLGADFQFTTKVYLLGRDVAVVGDYDPTLGDPVLAAADGKTIYAELDRWAGQIRDKAAGRFSGDILVCAGTDRRADRHADWPASQHGRWYSAPAAALNFHDNCVDVGFRVKDEKVTAQISPASRFITIVNKVTVGRRHLWRLGCGVDDATITLSGAVRRSTPDPYSVAINDGPLLLGRVLADRIERQGVRLAGKVRRVRADALALDEATLLCQTGTPLAAVMKRANKPSLNMAAECLFLRAGDGTFEGSARIMSQTLTDAYGLAPQRFVVRDGSGLSRRNRVTPTALTTLLVRILRRADADVLLASLPISGVDGTMRTRLRQPPYQGRVIAKTGHLRDVSCLAGYVRDAAGEPVIALAILVNDARRSARAVQDDICRLLVDSVWGR